MSKRKLLLADDSITIQKVVNLTFADEGVEVISVGDGNSAMDKLREDMPDLVMADVNMPGLNGYEICEMIKQSDTNGDIPVILLVGSFEPFDEEEAKRVGADDYLTKPFQSISQLVDKVSALLKLDNGLRDENLEDTAEMPFIAIDTDSTSGNNSNELSANMSENFGRMSDEFDDEMIQTDQVGSLPVDDSVKFQTASVMSEIGKDDEIIEEQSVSYEVADEDYQSDAYGEDAEIEFGEEPTNIETEDFLQTQPLSPADYQELSLEETSDDSVWQTEQKTLDEEDSISSETDDFENFESEMSEETSENTFEDESSEVIESAEEERSKLPMPEVASILHLDEMNLLDLPPLEGAEEESSETVSSETTSDISDDEVAVNESANVSAKMSERGISDEMVEAITQKVVDKLSEQAVREIAWEVVPQMADLIIKKMVEEKMQE